MPPRFPLRALLLLACALLLAGCAQPAPPAPRYFPPATPQAVESVTARVFPAVVRLDVKQEVYSDGKRTMRSGIGSGVIFDDNGRILTNFHVAGRAAEIYVTLFNKERVSAHLIGDDHWTDLAVVQMNMDEVKRRQLSFAHAEMGDSATLVPGQDVMAIGTPFGFARTCTRGQVSNADQTFYPTPLKVDEYETGDFSNWVQMDTPINPGNSGGPLVDMNGKVVGINTRGGGQNLNFAVPINIAKEVIAKILATALPDAKGYVDRSDLGIDLKPMQDLESFYHVDINKGALIQNVDRGSAAARVGVKAQDILLAVNGQPINVRFPEELAPARKRIADLPIGSPVTLSIQRGAQTFELKMETEQLESSVGEERELKKWGMSVRDITRAYANDHQLDDDKGVCVTTLSTDYPAATAGLKVGDVIRKVNEKPVEDLDAFMRLYRASLKPADAKVKEVQVLLDVRRDHTTSSMVLRVEVAPATQK